MEIDPNKLNRYAPLLGIVNDKRLASIAGVCPETIRNHRRKLGIQPARSVTFSATLEKCRPVVGTDTDSQIARKTGFSYPKIYYIRKALGIPSCRDESPKWVTEYQHLFGKMEDRKIGKMAGVARDTVKRWRLRLGIKSEVKHGKSHDFSRSEWFPIYGHLLGTMPDSHIAKMAGVSRISILQMRQKLGIKTFGKGR